MKKYRIKENSIADYMRIALVSVVFWGALLAVAVNVYM